MKLTDHKYVVVQHKIKYWNGMDVKYVKDDDELVDMLYEIAKAEGIAIENTGDVIQDVITAVGVFNTVHVFEMKDRRFSFGSKMLDDLFKRAAKDKLKEEA